MSLIRRAAAYAALVALSATLATGAGAARSATVVLSESSNGRTIAVNPGAHLTLTLHSAYWSVIRLPKQTTVIELGKTTTVGVLPGATSGCVAGQGCGTVTARFVAGGSGRVRLRATRTSCGEALRCTPSQSLWTVVIRVR